MLPLLLDSRRLREWASTRVAQDTLPLLVRRLVLASVRPVPTMDFPSGDLVATGGWDGIVASSHTVPHGFIPFGPSVWELSVESKVQAKATSDFQKRSTAPGAGIVARDTAYVAVTLRKWSKKAAWVKDRRAQAIWRDVRALDVADIEQWLEQAPAVATWMARMCGSVPPMVTDLVTAWDEWCAGTSPRLSRAIVGASTERDRAGEQVTAFLRGAPGVLSLQAGDRDEAVGFLAAMISSLPVLERASWFARAVIAHEAETMRALAAHPSPLLVIPSFDAAFDTRRFVDGGHHVFLAAGRDRGALGPGALTIDRLERNRLIDALVQAGTDKDEAARLAKRSGRRIPTLRRIAAAHPPFGRPAWAGVEDGPFLASLVLLGGWNEASEADKAAVEATSQQSYSSVRTRLARVASLADPPVVLTGSIWRWTAPDDAFGRLAPYIDDALVLRFCEVAVAALGERDPALELAPGDRWKAAFEGHVLGHSGQLRHGCAEGLSRLACPPAGPTFPGSAKAEAAVSAAVRRVVDGGDWHQIASLGQLLPILMEAGPDEVLAAIERLVGDKGGVVAVLTDGGWMSGHAGTGILWALECAAWSPSYLARAARLLATLASLDPGGQWANRPQECLREIFLSWLPHTSADLATREIVLGAIAKVNPDVAWRVALRMLPQHGGDSASPTWLPKRRAWVRSGWDHLLVSDVSRNHWSALRFVDDLLGNNARRWAEFVPHLDILPDEQRTEKLQQLERLAADLSDDSDRERIWSALRSLLHWHRQHADESERAFPPEVGDAIEAVYNQFAPVAFELRYSWVFDSGRANLPVRVEGGWRAEMKALDKIAEQALGELVGSGIDAVLRFAGTVPHGYRLGYALGGVVLAGSDDEAAVMHWLADDAAWSLRALIAGFVDRRREDVGNEWLDRALVRVSPHGPVAVGRLLSVSGWSTDTWDRAQAAAGAAQATYWKEVLPGQCLGTTEEGERALRALLGADRAYAALEYGGRWLSVRQREAPLGGRVLADVLLTAITKDPGVERPTSGGAGLVSHNVEQIMGLIQKAGDVPVEEIAKLEWMLLPALDRQTRPRVLYETMATQPSFFVDIIRALFRAKDEAPRESPATPEQKLKGERAFRLLNAWKTMPITIIGDPPDPSRLLAWVSKCRELAAETKHDEITLDRIGHLLASDPRTGDTWPSEPVCDVVEFAASEDLDAGFVSGTFSRRGVFTKAIAEGGRQESDLAAWYAAQAERLAISHPRTAAVLRKVAVGYRHDAAREDERSELEEDAFF